MYQGSVGAKNNSICLAIAILAKRACSYENKENRDVSTGQVWSGVPHGARAAVLRCEMCHERAHVGVQADFKCVGAAFGELS